MRRLHDPGNRTNRPLRTPHGLRARCAHLGWRNGWVSETVTAAQNADASNSRTDDKKVTVTSINPIIRPQHAAIITSTDMLLVRRGIEDIARRDGLGIAMTVAWQHGLTSGYIPLTLDDEPPMMTTAASAGCPYTFVHVPVRRIRGDTEELVRRRIMNGAPDPSRLGYHEDGIIEARTFGGESFASLTAGDVTALLDSLAASGLLVRMEPEDPRIRFVEPGSVARFTAGGEHLFVRDTTKPVRASVEAALGGSRSKGLIGEVCGALQRRSPCFYCSAATLFPREVTVSALRCSPEAPRPPLARDYRLGFTFAPVGHPGRFCHFLAWDDPSPGTHIENMDFHPYSFRDLVQLVQTLDDDPTHSGDPAPPPLWGICNHRAGNTIAHQHFQFFRLPTLPLEDTFRSSVGGGLQPIASLGPIGVWTSGTAWPTPAYLIAPLPGTSDDTTQTNTALLEAVDLFTDAWRSVRARNITQNLIVTSRDGQTRAIFLPRDRTKIDTRHGEFTKHNAGALEAAGHFIIDDTDAFQRIANLTSEQRHDLGTGWLTGLAPKPEWISRFELELRSEAIANST